MKHPETSRRLIEAMNDIGIKPRELSKRADVKEASVSQYINGTHKPSNKSAGQMGEVLGVNPVWLMGFDVPKYAEVNLINLSILTKENLMKLSSYYQYLLSEQEDNNGEIQ